VIGATGFTGAFVTKLLIDEGADVTCFVRSTSDVSVLPLDRVRLCFGDLDDSSSISKALEAQEFLVTVASLGFGHAPAIVRAACEARVRRAVFLSSTSIFTTLNPDSKKVRIAAEQSIKYSGIPFTILRPTMIYGSSRDRNMTRLVRLIQRWRVVPVVGPGTYLQQPVYVGDVADAAVLSLSSDRAVGGCYNIAGADPMTFLEVIDTIAAALGKRVRKLPLSAGPFLRLLKLAERLSVPLPINSEQIQRLNENKAFDYEAATADFGYRPRGFSEGIRLQLREMGLSQESS
jgi:nucleoside-diphosphate-sugar epimerase